MNYDLTKRPTTPLKATCVICGCKVKPAALANHMRDVHKGTSGCPDPSFGQGRSP